MSTRRETRSASWAKSSPGLPGRIDRRHDALIEHVQVDVETDTIQPAAIEALGDAIGHLGQAAAQDLLDGEERDRALECAGRGLLGLRLAVADLDRVGVGDQGRADVGPRGQERLTAAGRQRKVQPGHRAEPRRRVEVARVEEVDVAVDVHEASAAPASGTNEAAEQDAAVAAENERELVGGSVKLHEPIGSQPRSESRVQHRLWRAPRTGFVPGRGRPKAQIGGPR